MIQEEKVAIIIKTSKMAKEYSNKTGLFLSIGNSVLIDPILLPKGSHALITGVCDICGKTKPMEYRTYYRITKGLQEPYQCVAHTVERTKNKMLQLYGVENPFQVEEYKEKSRQTSIRRYGVPYHTQTEEFKQQYLYGDKNYFYRKGGKPTDIKYENTSELKQWRKAVYEKYNYTCAICGKSKFDGEPIHAHHLWGYFDFPEKMYDKDNGIVLCAHHHSEFHWRYQEQIITPQLFQEYIQGLTTISKESTAEDELPLEVHRNLMG